MLYPAKELTDQQRANVTWRYKSLNIMLWTLGKIEQLSSPGEICDVETIVGLLINSGRLEFEKPASIKNKAEISDELDMIYRMHCACVVQG